MGKKMLIDAAHPEETRVVVVQGNRIEEFDFESAAKKQLRGSIYLAKVTRVEPSLQAAFVDYGGNRHGFLAFSEIHPDYYQIPVADREALLEEQAAEQRRIAEEQEEADLERERRRARRTSRSSNDSEDGDDRRNARGRGDRRRGRRGGRRGRWQRGDRRGRNRDPLTPGARFSHDGTDPTLSGAPSEEVFGPFLPGQATSKIERARSGTDPLLPGEHHGTYAVENTEEGTALSGYTPSEESEQPPADPGWAGAYDDGDKPHWDTELETSENPVSSQPLLAPSVPSISVDLPGSETDGKDGAQDVAEGTGQAEAGAEIENLDEAHAESADEDALGLGTAGDNITAKGGVWSTPEAEEESGTPAEARGTDEDEGEDRGDTDDSDEEDDDADEVEAVGSGDDEDEVEAQAEQRSTRRSRLRQYKIQEVIKRRQIMLVQVVKEERGNKGAALTTYLSLAGRYCVLMPNTARGGGISRKITQPEDRKRLKDVAGSLDVPDGMGLIVRTAGAQRTKGEIKRDFEYLLRLWETVRDLTLRSTAPTLVYEEGSLIKRSIRDLYSKDIDSILVEGDEGYKDAKAFMKMLMPSHARNVQPYKDRIPLFQRYQVETQLDSMFSPQVQLPSGGYLVINSTEALVAIDVNSGRATREHSIEDTAYKTNMEAAEEVARQLRLRDLAGLIVIDFIDMEDTRNNKSVERRLKDCLKSDRARIQVGRISSFGLLEMSRQRLRAGVLEGSTLTCPHCEGSGKIRSVESAALKVLRACEEEGLRERVADVTVRVPQDVAIYILNHKRRQLMDMFDRYGLEVIISPDNSLYASDMEIERGEPLSAERKAQIADSAISMETAFNTFAEEDEAEAEAEDDTEEDQAEESKAKPSDTDDADDGDEDRQQNRRRRTRHRPRREDKEDAKTASNERNGEDNGEKAASPDGEEDDDGKQRRRRRGRRGGRRNNRRTNGKVDKAESGDPATADQPPMAAWNIPDNQQKQKETTQTPIRDGSQESEMPKRPRRRREPAMAEESTGPADSYPTSGNTDTEDSGPKRKGWWQRRFF